MVILFMAMDVSELLRLISKGESERVEFKKNSSGIGEEICAMTNAVGGTIIIGVDDNGSIVGCDVKREKERVASFLSSIMPPPKIAMEEVDVGGKKLLVVKVEKSPVICTIGGIAYIRVGSAKRPLSIAEIVQIGSELTTITYDELPTNAPASEMEESFWKKFLERREERGLKVSRNLAEKMRVVMKKNRSKLLSVAGLLMFHKHPQMYMPHARVRLKAYGMERVVEGPVWMQVEEVVKAVSELSSRVEAVGKVERKSIPVFPARAMREAIVNALVHRNYAIHSEVFVDVMPFRVSIRNPGSFPPGSSPESPRPVPRNPLLYDLMFQMGYVEKQGSGIESMKRICAINGISISYSISSYFTTLEMRASSPLDETDMKILELLSDVPRASYVEQRLGMSRPAIVERLKKLERLGLVERRGRGRSVEWLPL